MTVNKKPFISACLIVKNEAPRLASCLTSLQAVADEIIIVDTGSADETLSIARQYTDQVFSHLWQEDFSAARNTGIKHATGDWILIFDADEVLPLETAALLPSYLARPEFQAKPLVLNWRVCSSANPDLYTRGLFPNHWGITFAGRVHEIPVLPDGSKLPSYHCQELRIDHEPVLSSEKRAFYQRLMETNLAEESDLRLRNHLQKHLGLSYLVDQRWQDACTQLTACAQSCKTLGLSTEDGFYQEVLAGLQLAQHHSQQLKKQKTSFGLQAVKRASKLLAVSVLVACQGTQIPPTQKHSPSLANVPLIQELNSKPFGIKYYWLFTQDCAPEFYSQLNSCYNAGGTPYADGVEYPSNQYATCMITRCDLPEPEQTPWPEPTPEPTEPPLDEHDGGGGNSEKDCEDLPLITPDLLDTPLQKMANLAQSVQGTDFKPELNNWDKAKRQIEATQQKIAAEQAQATPNENKLQQWQQQIEQYEQQKNEVGHQTHLKLSEIGSHRVAVSREINTVVGDSRYSRPKYSGPNDARLPQSFEAYKQAAQELDTSFDSLMEFQNSFDLLDAANVVLARQELHSYLIQGYLDGHISAPSDEGTEPDASETLVQITTPRRLIRYLERQISQDANRLQNRQTKLKNEFENDLDNIDLMLLDSTQMLTNWQNDYKTLFPEEPDFFISSNSFQADFTILDELDAGDQRIPGAAAANLRLDLSTRAGLGRTGTHLSNLKDSLASIMPRINQLEALKSQGRLTTAQKKELQSLHNQKNQLKQQIADTEKLKREGEKIIDGTVKTSRAIDRAAGRCNPCESRARAPYPQLDKRNVARLINLFERKTGLKFDAHKIKQDILGTKNDISHYNITMDTKTGILYVRPNNADIDEPGVPIEIGGNIIKFKDLLNN